MLFFLQAWINFRAYCLTNGQQDKQHKRPQSHKFRNKSRIYLAVYFSTMTVLKWCLIHFEHWAQYPAWVCLGPILSDTIIFRSDKFLRRTCSKKVTDLNFPLKHDLKVTLQCLWSRWLRTSCYCEITKSSDPYPAVTQYYNWCTKNPF